MNIPKDIVEKYNYLKMTTYESLGLPFAPGIPSFNANAYNSITSAGTADPSSK